MSGARVGIGYDVHRLAEGRKLVIGGVEIPHTLGLLGHSDADVLCHAVTDALLGAAALGDIGTHFPDTDPAYAGASSLDLLVRAAALVAECGYDLDNVDATLLLEAPKVAAHIPAMRQNLARALSAEVSQVSVKATTMERLGPVGRGEGAACMAVALLRRRRPEAES